MCLFFFVRQIFSTLPCLDKLGVAPRKHQVTSVVLTPTCFSLWASEARQGQGRRRIFIRSLTHMYIHTRTHTAPRHALLFARHAVAPADSVVVLSREAPPQALHCSRARALTKTRGKAGCFATLAKVWRVIECCVRVRCHSHQSRLQVAIARWRTRRVEGGTRGSDGTPDDYNNKQNRQAGIACLADWARTGAAQPQEL